MMHLIVDANIIFAVIIKRGLSLELFVNNNLELFAPEYLYVELEKHKDLLLDKSGFSNEDFDDFIGVLRARIKVISETNFDAFKDKAKLICPDENDYVYFALAMALNCPIWSNDKLLKNQNVVDVINTAELIKLLGDESEQD